ncbi:MAG: DUF3098 domain-containing protein [Bacteroidales bacterium]|nr:DUF3098 domain-containing protein [Bacteroidales bacterium]MDT3356321.1 DUF3098 domain-containing protein [Bacteroidota bacterium]
MDKNFAMDKKGLRLLLAGLIVMVSGYILMIGGGSDDPAVFNWAMFDFRRLVAAPLVIICGVVIEVIAIMGCFKGGKKGEDK